MLTTKSKMNMIKYYIDHLSVRHNLSFLNIIHLKKNVHVRSHACIILTHSILKLVNPSLEEG